MKKSILLCLLAFSFSVSAQNIWRCNNDPSVTLSPNMFRTLQAAHDAATAGDIIYVEPSYNGMSYGILTCTKTLRIIGNGYYHGGNETIISQPFFRGESIIGGMFINSTAPSTTIEGLWPGTCYIKAQNVKITRCIGGNYFLIRDNLGSNASGAVITKNIAFNVRFTGYYENSPSPSCAAVDYQIENVIIKNNLRVEIDWVNSTALRRGGSCSTNSYEVPSLKNSTISNNSNITNLNLYGENTVFHSNICSSLYLNGTFAFPSNYVTASNNVCDIACGYGANNLDNVTWNTVFTSSNPSTLDNNYRLSPTSPAIGVGLGGVDAGAFGTNDPYRLSGLAPIPQITSYSKNASSGVYTTTTPMTVTLSVRGNN